jgi:hypothetical protein
MITLENDRLVFRFPEVHEKAFCIVQFQRTLRLPDNGKTYPLPAGLGALPLRHIDDFERIPESLRRRGGVTMPMWQGEAMWIRFNSANDYPIAVKISAGKVNAVSGEDWLNGLHRDPQDYVVLPKQPWLDGYAVTRGTIRQFVAAPLGKGITAEEQLTGAAEHGGVQIVVHPMKREAYERMFAVSLAASFDDIFARPVPCGAPAPMGLAPGGLMHQEIYDDPYDFDAWDLRRSARCFVSLLNAESWAGVTGEPVPTEPPTARAYHAAGIPWFDYYSGGGSAVDGSARLAGLKTIVDAESFGLGGKAWEDEPVVVTPPVPLGPGVKPGRRSNEVRQGDFF